MKRLLLSLSFVLALSPARAGTIAPDETSQHVGQNVIVEGLVNEVHHASSGKVIFIDMGGRYPNNTFTAVIFADEASKFPNVDSLEGKTIDVSGLVSLYKGRPEIILNDPMQIKMK